MATRSIGPRRSPLVTIVSTVLVVGLFVGWLGALADTTLTSGRALAAPALQTAADYLPSQDEMPPDFREVSTVDVGGLLEPDMALRRTFVNLDGSQSVAVQVAINPSSVAAQSLLDARLNQLARYRGWLFATVPNLGEWAYGGSGAADNGQLGQILVFRVNAIAAEVGLQASQADTALLHLVARVVEARMHAGADAALNGPAFATPTPQSFPGVEPPGPPADLMAALSGGGGGVGNSAGGVGVGDTVVLFTLLGIERPWRGGSGPPPPNGFDYLTVDVTIETQGPTPANIVLEDFTASTLDGREWPGVVARQPAMRAGQVVQGSPIRGWLTFAIPTNQPATQVTWRLRSTLSPDAPGGGDQILILPLTVGATSTATIGNPAPPAGVPVQPPNVVPPGSAPVNPGGSGGSGGGSGGGGRGSGGRPRLQ